MRHTYGNAYIHSNSDRDGNSYAYAYSDSDGYIYADGNRASYAYADSDCDCHVNSKCHCDSNSYSHSDGHRTVASYTDATASPDTGASSLTLLGDRELARNESASSQPRCGSAAAARLQVIPVEHSRQQTLLITYCVNTSSPRLISALVQFAFRAVEPQCSSS
jgi:hypothetical protein